MRLALVLLVAIMGVLALSLAWLSLNERAGLIVFTGFACLFIGIACAALFVRSSWITWTLSGLAIVGIIAIIWAIVMVTAMTNHQSAMALRNVELDQPFLISSAARPARVGPLTIRHKNIAASTDNNYDVSLAITISEPHHSTTEIILQKGGSSSISIAKVGHYRIELLDVSSTESNKRALYKATLKVSIVMTSND